MPVGEVLLQRETLRACIEYHGLNEINVKNKYTLPLIISVFKSLHGASLLMWSFEMLTTSFAPGRVTNERQLLTPCLDTEYLIIPFSLTNTPAVFQVLVNDVLKEFMHVFIFVNLDNVLVFSKTQVGHQVHVCCLLK